MDVSGITALDVAIGIAFLYFLLSLVCSAVVEGIAGWFKLRALELERGIRRLLASERAAAEFYDKWRIKALFKPAGRIFKSERKPSYISPRAFALTVMDTFAPPSDGVESKDLIKRANSKVAEIDNETVKGMVNDALLEAREGADKFRESLERSFDEVMDRVSGWYKRRTQLILFCVALVVVGATNADTFAIGERLWKDDALRGAVVARAVQQEGEANTATTCKDGDEKLTSVQDAAKCLDRIKELGLPVGWTDDTTPKATAGAISAKVAGLLVTVFAVMLGAPFWFDLLGKFARLRSTGKREGTTKEPDRAAVDRDERR
jgi:hypothetical protein